MEKWKKHCSVLYMYISKCISGLQDCDTLVYEVHLLWDPSRVVCKTCYELTEGLLNKLLIQRLIIDYIFKARTVGPELGKGLLSCVSQNTLRKESLIVVVTLGSMLRWIWNSDDKNLGRLWLAYTELQGDFTCYNSYLLTLGTLRSQNSAYGGPMWACSQTINYWKGSWADVD